MTIPNRKFGVEIECLNVRSPEVLIEKIRAAGIGVLDAHYGAIPTKWDLKYDASIEGYYGRELVSPPLLGEEGLLQVQKVCEILVEQGVVVNSSCGLHVHIDAAGFTANDLKSIVARYAKYERDIDSFMPISRRNNVYCGSAAELSRQLQRSSETVCGEAMIHNIDPGRFYKVNVRSFLRHNTVEFRQHSGSINGQKIKNWIIFCLHFVEDSKVRVIPAVVVPPSPGSCPEPEIFTFDVQATAGGRRSIQNKITILKQLVETGRMNTQAVATTLGIREASAGSIICQLRTQYGLTIKRHRNSFDFYINQTEHSRASAVLIALEQLIGVRPRLTHSTPITPLPAQTIFPHEMVGDSLFAKMPIEIVHYYNERTLELAS